MKQSVLKMSSLLLVTLVVLLFITVGCKVDSEEPLEVGDSYGGGIVAYIYESGDTGYVEGEVHGLIAASDDQSSSIVWATANYNAVSVPALVRGAGPVTSQDFGSGSDNTDMIIAQHDQTSVDPSLYAAGIARSYEGGGYTDWFLPSSDELFAIHGNRVAIGGGGFEQAGNVPYWSSSEYGNNQAYGIGFTSIAFNENYIKSQGAHVRSVRYF